MVRNYPEAGISMRNNLVLPGRRLMQIDFDSLQSNAKGQFLFGWTPNPGTAFYVGYNDDINRRGFNPFTGQLEPGLHPNGRTFFIKMSYLFRRSFG